jgi:hypothetical protein
MRIIAILASAMIMASCQTLADHERREILLTIAAKPVKVISVSGDQEYCAVTFMDCRGNVFTLSGESFRSFQPGDTIK